MLLLVMTFTANAQNQAPSRDAHRIELSEVTPSNHDQLDDPVFYSILNIKNTPEQGFEDESQETAPTHFQDSRPFETRRQDETNRNFGNNILGLNPFHITTVGVGFSISYERALDEDNYFSFYIPATLSFPVESDIYRNANPYFFLSPGLKIYPTGGKGKVRYGVGPSLVMVYARDDLYPDYYPQYPGISFKPNEPIFMLGMMVTNSLNMNPNEHLHLSLELGLGTTYYHSFRGMYTSTGSFGQAPQILVDFGFKMGYRF